MSTLTDTAPHVPAGRGGIARSIADSLVVTKRNLIRMTRIPNPVREDSIRSDSLRSWPDSVKEQVA